MPGPEGWLPAADRGRLVWCTWLTLARLAVLQSSAGALVGGPAPSSRAAALRLSVSAGLTVAVGCGLPGNADRVHIVVAALQHGATHEQCRATQSSRRGTRM